jgi:hypothetical protein
MAACLATYHSHKMNALRYVVRCSAVLVVGSLLAGCGFPKTAEVPALAGPADVAAAKARWPDVSEGGLAAGRTTFTAKCNGCHGYPDVRAVGEADWPAVAERMGKKANLDAAATESVLRFILVARKAHDAN